VATGAARVPTVAAAKRSDPGPLVDPDEARDFDRGSRTLDRVLVTCLSYYAALGVLIALATTAAVGAIAGAVAVAWEIWVIAYMRRLRRARLVNFVDPLTGEVVIPGGALPLAAKVRYGTPASTVLVVTVVIAFALTR
jgi:hypothetical protein